MEMKLSDRMNKGLLLVPVLMFLGLTVYEGIVFLLQILLETFGNEMQQIRWESFFLDRARYFGVFCAFILFIALLWIVIIPWKKHLSRKQRLAWCAGYLLFSVLMLGFVLPQLGRVRETFCRTPCYTNLKQIYIALRMYADDYSGFLPPDLETLKNGYLTDDRTYYCPTQLKNEKPGRIDYEYYGRGHKITYPPFLLLADRDGNHPFLYRNMMLSDGTNCSRQIKKPEK